MTFSVYPFRLGFWSSSCLSLLQARYVGSIRQAEGRACDTDWGWLIGVKAMLVSKDKMVRREDGLRQFKMDSIIPRSLRG